MHRAVARLEGIATEPWEINEHHDELVRLQYVLHLGSEHVWGMRPPEGAELAHSALAVALADARDVTGRIVSAVDDGNLWSLERLAPEWRGSLERVRHARVRLIGRRRRRSLAFRDMTPQVAAVGLAVSGAVAMTEANVGPWWPIWMAVLLAFCGAIGLRRA
ncbi:MAG TPA: hypothetical protein VGH52_04365 [Gaiellaceae bacterium]